MHTYPTEALMVQPLPLPANFDPAAAMPGKTTEYGVFHEVRGGAALTAQLLANGAAADIELAHTVLAAVLAAQVRDPADPHVGAFTWMVEDDWIEDLNAVAFVLRSLIPMLLRHGDRLRPALRDRALESVRLGLTEIARLDVLVAYTNITALDIHNTCLGGELLQDADLMARGRAKLAAWIDFTNQSGHPHEFNSPTYTPVTLRALAQLAELTGDATVRTQARALVARLAVSAALHLHAGTGRWAGPHGRAYQPSIAGATPPERTILAEWVATGLAPAWLARLSDARPPAYGFTETASNSLDMALTTYQTPEYALGIASRGLSPQSNVCIAHLRRPAAEPVAGEEWARPGVFYTRCIVDDKWLGDSYHRTDRTRSRNLLDEGDFWGVQAENRGLGVYTPPRLGETRSVKVAWIWTQRAALDEIWVGDTPVTDLPHAVPPGATVVVGSGDAYSAVRPLAFTRLGPATPLRLVERQGDLVLERYLYHGPAKTFWELNWPGPFYHGRPFAAFYVELAARSDYADGAAFARAVDSGAWDEHLDPAFTYAGEGERRYRAGYRRAGREVGLEIDLMQWQLRRRWTETGDLGWPALDAPFAAQTPTGPLYRHDATVACDRGPVWLAALPAADLYLAGYLGREPADLTLTTPHGAVRVERMGMGVVSVVDGVTTIDAPHAAAT
jgi:hypothetical protein